MTQKRDGEEDRVSENVAELSDGDRNEIGAIALAIRSEMHGDAEVTELDWQVAHSLFSAGIRTGRTVSPEIVEVEKVVEKVVEVEPDVLTFLAPKIERMFQEQRRYIVSSDARFMAYADADPEEQPEHYQAATHDRAVADGLGVAISILQSDD